MRLVCLGLRFGTGEELELPKLTHLESVEYGWWYAARISSNQALITLYSDVDTVRQGEIHDAKNWIKLLAATEQTSRWASGLKPVDDQLLAFAAPSFCRDKIVGERWLAVGDCASTYDPITSHGIQKSIANGITASRVLADYFEGRNFAFEYESMIKQQYQAYLKMREEYYQLEQRWPESSFWKLMHSSLSSRHSEFHDSSPVSDIA